MENKYGHPVRQNSQDAMLERYLAERIVSPEAAGPCPAAEDIAALADGMLEVARKDELLRHVDACPDCRELLAETVKMKEAFAFPVSESVSRKRPVLFWTAAAVAAVIAVNFAVKLIWQPSAEQSPITQLQKPETAAQSPETGSLEKQKEDQGQHVKGQEKKGLRPLTARELLARLPQETSPAALVKGLNADEFATFGFAGSPTPEKLAFATGVHIARIETALWANDRGQSLAALDKMIKLLKVSDEMRTRAKSFAAIKEGIISGNEPKQYVGKVERLDSHAKSKNAELFLLMGEWAEAGRILATADSIRAIDGKSARFFLDSPGSGMLPATIWESLKAISSIYEKQPPDEADRSRLIKAFRVIVEEMT